MRNDRVKSGMMVVTKQGPSGGLCKCIVIGSIGSDDPLGHDYGYWSLDSPSHGYSIVRHHTDFNPVKLEPR